MTDELLKQILAEIIEAQATANAILVMAVAKQLNHVQLRRDIVAAATLIQTMPDPMPPTTLRLLDKVLSVLPENSPH